MESQVVEPQRSNLAAFDSRRAKAGVFLEIVAILGLVFVYAGSPPPGVNEAHYLTKAKHYWNPSWCGEDVFLDSLYPHLAFYWLFGWITLFASLPTTAWIGRLIVWSLFATAWQRLSWSVLPQRFASLGTAALFLLFVERFHLAGEWAVGGIEAKAVAYPLVFFGLRSVVLGHWRAVWLWLGAASALHVLVGGWSVVAAAMCWLLGGKSQSRFSRMIPALLAGGGVSLVGLIPALRMSKGAPPAVIEEANQIYVFGRLPHHLVFHEFAPQRLMLFGVLLVIWIAISWYLRDRSRWWSINRFAMASLVISCVGIAIDGLGNFDRELAARLLKLYWFRLADVAVPVAVALGGVISVRKVAPWRPRWAGAAWVLLFVVSATWLGGRVVRQQIDFRPRAETQSRPAERHGANRMHHHYRAWRRVCGWIQQQTPPTSRFLTPRNQQTFKWYAGRAELACWKDIPQDPENIVRWWRLLGEVYTPEVIQGGLGCWSDEELKEIADDYQIDYILIDRLRTDRRLGFHRVYPTPTSPNAYFEVYRVHGDESLDVGEVQSPKRRGEP
ncbi:MAG: DUF6798 domain-containing protein [Planctomycetota bacterium]